MFNKIFNLFKKKYTLVLLDSKWNVLEKNLKLRHVPRQKEYIWLKGKYYQVTHIVHNILPIQQISIVVAEVEPKITGSITIG